MRISCLFFFLSFSVLSAEPIRHTLDVDNNKLALWEKSAKNPKRTILLLHGRTYSSLPNFDFHAPGENLSLMDALVEKGYAVFALDQPGYGSSPRDVSGWFTPSLGVKNIAATLKWIADYRKSATKPVLFGWSLGSTMSLLTAQKYPELVSELILFGFWRDIGIPMQDDPIIKRVVKKAQEPLREPNMREQAIEDFVAPNAISKSAIDAFGDIALKADPIRVDIRNVIEFGDIDPARIKAPTLILQGQYDSVLSTAGVGRLFMSLANPDRQWIMIAGGDHAAHLEKTRDAFVAAMVNFMERPTN